MIATATADPPRSAMPAHPAINAEFLDFRDRSRGLLAPAEIPAAIAAGRFVWLDADRAAVADAELARLLPESLAEQPAIAAILAADHGDAVEDGRTVSTLSRTDEAIHIRLVGARDTAAGIVSDILDVVITAGLLLTFHQGRCGVLDAVRGDYISDFERHAATPSFLVYEFWDKQIDQFLTVQRQLDEEVETIRLALRQSADEATLTRLADVSSRLLALRKRVLPARRVLEELVARKTTLISEATLEFLGKMIDTLERLLADITANREILESAMNFSLTVMTHRTNLTMNRLAVVSTIFLPLTFLCGVYGMNFEVMPELEWQHSYAMFWVVSAIITITLTIVLKRARLL
jgi:magnesium transporter